MDIKEISWEDVEEKIRSVSPIRVEIREPKNPHEWELTKIIERADIKVRLELDEDNIKKVIFEIWRRALF